LPSSYDAIDDFNAQLDFVAMEISAEYTRMFNGDITEDSAPKGKGNPPSPRAKGQNLSTSAYITPS
jgi:hypothetical protein